MELYTTPVKCGINKFRFETAVLEWNRTRLDDILNTINSNAERTKTKAETAGAFLC